MKQDIPFKVQKSWFIHEAQESDVDILRQHIQASLSDSRFGFGFGLLHGMHGAHGRDGVFSI